jgi:lipopolysaccharide export LptBFGC system permease protein LptF
MTWLANPTPRQMAVVSACAIALLLAAAWMVNFGGPDLAAYAFPPLLIGLVLLFAAAAQLVLWLLNRATD